MVRDPPRMPVAAAAACGSPAQNTGTQNRQLCAVCVTSGRTLTHVCHPIVERSGAFVQPRRRFVDRPVTVTDGRSLAFQPGHLAFLLGHLALTNGSWPDLALAGRRHAHMVPHQPSARPAPNGRSGRRVPSPIGTLPYPSGRFDGALWDTIRVWAFRSSGPGDRSCLVASFGTVCTSHGPCGRCRRPNVDYLATDRGVSFRPSPTSRLAAW
jgi:hypothetical protein